MKEGMGERGEERGDGRERGRERESHVGPGRIGGRDHILRPRLGVPRLGSAEEWEGEENSNLGLEENGYFRIIWQFVFSMLFSSSESRHSLENIIYHGLLNHCLLIYSFCISFNVERKRE